MKLCPECGHPASWGHRCSIDSPPVTPDVEKLAEQVRDYLDEAEHTGGGWQAADEALDALLSHVREQDDWLRRSVEQTDAAEARVKKLEAERDENARYLLDDEQLARLSAIHAAKERAEAEVVRLREALAAAEKERDEVARALAHVAPMTPHVYGCNEPDDESCARCVLDSEVARYEALAGAEGAGQ